MFYVNIRLHRLCGLSVPTLIVCVLVAAIGCSSGSEKSLSSLELEGIKAADQAYAAAWLTNDSEQVMATLTSDAVIAPSGMPAIEGPAAIRQFWWPEGSPPANITGFVLVQYEISGHGDMGFVRGTFSLEFEYDGEMYTGRGVYFSLLRRVAGDSWKISRRMWSDQPPDARD